MHREFRSDVVFRLGNFQKFGQLICSFLFGTIRTEIIPCRKCYKSVNLIVFKTYGKPVFIQIKISKTEEIREVFEPLNMLAK